MKNSGRPPNPCSRLRGLPGGEGGLVCSLVEEGQAPLARERGQGRGGDRVVCWNQMADCGNLVGRASAMVVAFFGLVRLWVLLVERARAWELRSM